MVSYLESWLWCNNVLLRCFILVEHVLMNHTCYITFSTSVDFQVVAKNEKVYLGSECSEVQAMVT